MCDLECSTLGSGEPWYQEVIELRKAAADYKCRGWGTDLVPPHLSSIYSQHVDEASNRESLSPLALAITPRYFVSIIAWFIV